MEATRRFVIFDIGGVLFRQQSATIESIAANFGVAVRDLRQLLSGPSSIEAAMGGSPFDTTAMIPLATERLAPLLGDRAHAAAGQLMGLYLDPSPERRNEAVIGLLPELRAAGIRLGILSNGPSDASPREWVSSCGLFDQMVVSGIDGVGKPSPEAFHLILARLGTTAANSWFIDDTLEMVEAARALGLTGVHFRGDVEELVSSLRATGLDW